MCTPRRRAPFTSAGARLERLRPERVEHAIPAGGRGGHRGRRCAAPEAEVGVRSARRRAVVGGASRCQAAACSSAALPATSIRSTRRPAACTGPTTPAPSCGRPSTWAASARATSARDARVLRRRARQHATPSTRAPGSRSGRSASRIASLRAAHRAPPSCTTDGSTCRCRPARKARARCPTTSAAVSAAASWRSTPRPAARSGRATPFPRSRCPCARTLAARSCGDRLARPIWSSPVIDAARGALYVTTGNNYSDPTTSDERRVSGDGSGDRAASAGRIR